MLPTLLGNLLLLLAALGANSLVAHPGLNFKQMGGSIALLGDFDGLSFYNYANDSAFLSLANNDDLHLYLRNSSGSSEKIATFEGGHVSQLLLVGEDAVLVSGNFSLLNGKDYALPVIYNATTGDFYSLFSTKREESLSGNVLTTFVDGDLIYLGGDFEYNSTKSAAVYNVTSRSLLSLPFQGFGNDSVVNAISKYSENDNDGSIIFGGSFQSLGLPELLTHNILHLFKHHNSSNSTNTTFISAEQVVSLKHATFGNVAGASSNLDSSVICPSTSPTWALADNSGGQWNVELPLEMQGIIPTKVRIYVPEDSQNGIKTFRIYSYPNNGIMNLTYIDPTTNDVAYCDAWCPLQLGSTLSSSTEQNIEEADSYSEEDLVHVDEDGSFFMYYSSDSQARNMGYGRNYQEFALVNQVSSQKIGLITTSWYGSRGEFSGFELYLDSISVYGNDTLNESNCGSESNKDSNLAVVQSGTWQSVQDLSDITTKDYIVSVGTSSSITLYPNISYAGNYSLLFYTPGCSADNLCAKRSIINVSVLDTDENTLSSASIYQNNLEDKYDSLFYGHFNGSSEEKGRNSVKIDFQSAIDTSATDPWTVVDRVVANIVDLDNYDSSNLSNSSSTYNKKNYTLTTTSLNGLFEYSLGNFSLFELSKVYEGEGDDRTIKPTNNFVGNSSINTLSGELSESSEIKQIQYTPGSKQLLLLGNFESSAISLANNNLLTMKLQGYNTTSNEAESTLQSRSIFKREEFQGLNFNTSITSVTNTESGFVVLGQFSATGDNIKDLSNDNNTISTANNFALNENGQWYSFGNTYLNDDFSQFASISLNDTEYYIFSTENGETFQAWDNSGKSWSTLKNKLDITASVLLEKRDQQIIGGPSFGAMQYLEVDQARFLNNSEFSSFDLQLVNGSITNSYYVNSSFSVFGGKFQDNSTIENIALVSNNKASPLATKMTWDNDTFVSSLYVDTNEEHLFIGSNGTVSFGSTNTTGLVIYNLQNASFLSVQPPALSNSDGSPITVNAMAFNDDSNQLLVGGRFENAGSLSCSALCFFDISATRWTNPLTGSDSTTIAGEVTDAKFLDSNVVLVSGNLTLNGSASSFVVYDFSTGKFAGVGDRVNDIGDNYITKFIINEEAKGKVTNKMAALAGDSVIAFNTSVWSRIDGSIEYSDETQLLDLKLVKLSEKNSANPLQQYFSNDNALLLSGKFNLTNYGLVNSAFYDGSSWIPYVFALEGSGPGAIYSTLFEDVYRYQSSSDLKNSSHRLTTGQIVGVSFACALGSTALLGLLFIVPFFLLFKKKRSNNLDRRTHEDEMMNVVNPEDLFHEMDAQKKF